MAVRLLSGELLAIDKEKVVSVLDVKRQVAEALSCPSFLLSLLHEGLLLQGSQELPDLETCELVVLRSAPVAFVLDQDQQLLEAVAQRDVARVDALLAAAQPCAAARGGVVAVACEVGDLEVLDMLIQAGASLSLHHPLPLCAALGHAACARRLLAARADPAALAGCGRSPLQIACERGHLPVVKILILADMDLDFTGRYGRTPLQLACEQGHLEVAQALLRAGADRERKGAFGLSPLQICAERGHLEMLRLLLQARARVGPTSRCSRTALQLASLQGHLRCAEELLAHGAETDGRSYGRTCLQLASEHGHAELVACLLNAGAKREVKGSYGRTPWQLACEHDHFQVVRLLLRPGR